jgi:hypothetical protein
MSGEAARCIPSLRNAWLLCAAWLCTAQAGEAALTPAARASLAAAACWSAGATRIETLRTRSREKGTGDVIADVKCQAHMEEGPHPVSHYARCEQHGGTWKCDAGYNALMYRQTNGPALLLVPRGIGFRDALDLIPELEKLRNRVGRPATAYLYGTCAVAKTVPFKGAEQFDILCDEGQREISLTRDCGTGQCRVFLVDARDVAK